MIERLITDAAAEGCFLRWSIAHDVDRAAVAIWWGYPARAALLELQGLAQLTANRGRFTCDSAAVARSALVEAYRRHGRHHAETAAAIRAAMLAALRSGQGRTAAAAAAAETARAARLPPPPHIVEDAVAEAMSEFSEANRSRRRRPRRAA